MCSDPLSWRLVYPFIFESYYSACAVFGGFLFCRLLTFVDEVELLVGLDLNDLVYICLHDIVLKGDFMRFPHPLSDWLPVPIVPLYCLLTLLY